MKDIDLFYNIYRAPVKKIVAVEPATWNNFITTYIKESTEYHRVRHV